MFIIPVLNALNESELTGHKKFPAAPMHEQARTANMSHN